MTAPRDHAALADELLHKAYHYTYGDGGDPVTGQALATQAAAHVLLAVLDRLDGLSKGVREVGDQLDTIPRTPAVKARTGEPLYEAASLLESITFGDEGPLRERTIARLIVGEDRCFAQTAARTALSEMLDHGDEEFAEKVNKAITALGIDAHGDGE